MPDLPTGFVMDLAVPEDIPALIWADRGANTLFASTGLIQPNALDQHVPAEVLQDGILQRNVLVVRREDGSPVGFALTTHQNQGLYLDQLSVHPDYGRRGLGRNLVLRLIMETESRRLPHITLSTFRDLPWNGPFYASMGFVEIARRKYEPFMFAIEDAQRGYMDVTSRCFMRRPVRQSIFRRRGK